MASICEAIEGKPIRGLPVAKVFSIHEYELRPGTDPAEFEVAIQEAEERGLFKLLDC